MKVTFYGTRGSMPVADPAYDPIRNFTISIFGKDRMGKDLERNCFIDTIKALK